MFKQLKKGAILNHTWFIPLNKVRIGCGVIRNGIGSEIYRGTRVK